MEVGGTGAPGYSHDCTAFVLAPRIKALDVVNLGRSSSPSLASHTLSILGLLVRVVWNLNDAGEGGRYVSAKKPNLALSSRVSKHTSLSYKIRRTAGPVNNSHERVAFYWCEVMKASNLWTS